MIPAKLYDGANASGVLIASITAQSQRRIVSDNPLAHKQDDRWEILVSGSGAVQQRITAEGITTLAWVATLYERQDALTVHTYHLAMADGDAHTGDFKVEEFDETASAGERRQFRLVLRSASRVTYNPA